MRIAANKEASVDMMLMMADDISTVNSSAVVMVTLDITVLLIVWERGSNVPLADSSVIKFCTGLLGTRGSIGTS